jgi:glycosyltransferase involved in cell wall biosynthesis
MKTEILLVTSIYPPQSGGPAIFTARFSNWLIKKNYEVKTITYCVAKEPSSKSVQKIKLRPFRFVSFIKFVIKIGASSNKNTIILANGAFVETFIASLLFRRKYVTKIPGDQVWEISKNKGWTNLNIEEFQSEKLKPIQIILRALLNLSFKHSKFVITPSSQLQMLATKWGINTEKINVIYNSVDSEKFGKIHLQKKFDLITVCRLVPWKGLEELIDYAIKLDLSLLIVGEGPLKNDLFEKASKFQTNINFIGHVRNDEIVTLLNQSRVFVLNSEYEATSYALIEAKMCGLPVIARDNSGNSTVVRNGIDGLIYSPSNKVTMGDLILGLLSDTNMTNNFGVEARKDAIERFNQDTNFQKILSLMVDE